MKKFALLLLLVACAPPGDGGEHDETEIITTVTLTFTPEGGSMGIMASFRDPDGDGGMSGTTDPLTLVAGTTYTMQVEFFDELGGQMDDITREVEAEAEAHQVFVVGGALADHTYADVESDYGPQTGDDLPVGLVNTLVTGEAGMGELVIVLRHMPELNGQPQKVAGLAEAFAAGDPLPGEVDANVSFELTVQ